MKPVDSIEALDVGLLRLPESVLCYCAVCCLIWKNQ